MLSENLFSLLNCCIHHPMVNQRQIAQATGLSLGTVNNLVRRCREEGWMDGLSITQKGLAVMEPYRVKNAIILAAGMSSRCAPLSYQKPKGLFTVKGEVLIERQIRQLQAAGIQDIYVVVGYMKELFFYLEEKFDVHIVINNEYTTRNNLSSVRAVRDKLGNSFICYSDNYLVENTYEPYAYHSYFAAMYQEGYTDEYIIQADKNGLIRQYFAGGEDSWYQMGEMYFDRETAATFLALLEREYQYACIFDMKIDDFYARHLSDMDIYIRKYPGGTILEFDTVEEIEKFDSHFIQNMGENILSNICASLGCQDGDIQNVRQIKRGMTNTIFYFEALGGRYVYRHPGFGTEKIIDRHRELLAQQKAEALGIDAGLVASNPEKGWKITKFIDNVDFDYENIHDEDRGIQVIRRLHNAHAVLGWEFDMLRRAEEMQKIVSAEYYDAFTEFADLRRTITRLYAFVRGDNYPLEMCHNDACDSNILLGKDATLLIDWEYAGDNDPASDIASFIIGCQRSREDCDRILRKYFGRELTAQELRHYYGFIAISAYFYFTWAIFKESTGQDIALTYIWYSFARTYGKIALELYMEV